MHIVKILYLILYYIDVLIILTKSIFAGLEFVKFVFLQFSKYSILIHETFLTPLMLNDHTLHSTLHITHL